MLAWLADPDLVSPFCHLVTRDSLAAQVEITLTKADSEQLARSIAEEQYSDLEKEKIMKELEIKEMMARHRQELGEKDTTIGLVSQHQLEGVLASLVHYMLSHCFTLRKAPGIPQLAYVSFLVGRYFL